MIYFDTLNLTRKAMRAQTNQIALADGEGKHHPDCPQWDAHVDNYDDDGQEVSRG